MSGREGEQTKEAAVENWKEFREMTETCEEMTPEMRRQKPSRERVRKKGLAEQRQGAATAPEIVLGNK
ncbi:UNVERIFIED_CONTAM: hypothetical protein HHA_452200 [Hammondia hammondi]|eukprot:XP_008885229.1 hypothetical protein HHA_452200 [Hammondia hammondi]